MFKIRSQVEGTADLIKAFHALAPKLSTTVLTDALMEGAVILVQSMEARAPKAPGPPNLAESLVAAPVRRGSRADVHRGSDQAAVGIGPSSRYFYYDLFQEFGTVHHAAHPFYRPAIDTDGQRALMVILSAIRRELVSRGALGSARTTPTGSL